MGETLTQQAIRLDLGSRQDTRLFRFQCGTFRLIDERYITVGVPGMSDTQGWHAVRITPEMVGRYVPIYTAIEVKALGGRTDKKRLALQTSFIATVRAYGGLAGFAFSVEQAREILNQAVGVLELPHG
jgi:hypothetical protein